MPSPSKTFQLFTAIDNPVPVLIFSGLSPADSNVLEDAIRKGDWWVDNASPLTEWHLAGVARYDVSIDSASARAAATKRLAISSTSGRQMHLIPTDQVATVDAAAAEGGWSTLPNGFRINWDTVSSYAFL